MCVLSAYACVLSVYTCVHSCAYARVHARLGAGQWHRGVASDFGVSASDIAWASDIASASESGAMVAAAVATIESAVGGKAARPR